MKKIFEFGKIDFCRRGRKCNAVTVEMEYKEEGDKKRFSVSASVWNNTRTDIVAGGQCLDSIAPFIHDKRFTEILRLWKLYHLNDMHPCKEEQGQTAHFGRRTERGDSTGKPGGKKSFGLVLHAGKRNGGFAGGHRPVLSGGRGKGRAPGMVAL